MKIKLYSTHRTKTIDNAITVSKIYFGELVELSELTIIKPVERKMSLYDKLMTWCGLQVENIQSISTDYISSLDHTGYDGAILFLDKSEAKETNTLYGQHCVKDGISYLEIYDTKRYYEMSKYFDKFGENYTATKTKDSQVEATTHCLIHELFHALSSFHKINDILHVFISEGQFDTYLNYLQANIKGMETNSEKLYKTALKFLGTDVTPRDDIPDSVACAVTVNTIHKMAFGTEIGGGASTYWLYDALRKSKDFQKVDTPDKGDIIISPTGYSAKGSALTNGHVGICGVDGKIMSNNSKTGLFSENFTTKSWKDYYSVIGKFPIIYFRKIN